MSFIAVLGLPDSVIHSSREVHLHKYGLFSEDLFLLRCGFAGTVGANAKVLLNFGVYDWECRLVFRLFVSSIVVVMEQLVILWFTMRA